MGYSGFEGYIIKPLNWSWYEVWPSNLTAGGLLGDGINYSDLYDTGSNLYSGNWFL